MELHENIRIKCDKCGNMYSDYFAEEGPGGKVRAAVCKKCGNTTYEEFIPNPNYVEPPTVTCPFCQSTDCKKISAASKIGKVALFGVLAAGSVSKTWHCNSCGSNFG